MKFSRGSIYIKGTLAAEAQDGEIEINSGDKDVITLSGYRGTTDGPVTATIKITRSIPQAGFGPSDLIKAIVTHEELTFITVIGATKYTVNGTLKTLNQKFATEQTATENTALTGGLKWEAY